MDAVVFGLCLGLAGLYFAPTFVALGRGRLAVGTVFGLNLLLGWTAIGWLLALLMARRGRTEADEARALGVPLNRP